MSFSEFVCSISRDAMLETQSSACLQCSRGCCGEPQVADPGPDATVEATD